MLAQEDLHVHGRSPRKIFICTDNLNMVPAWTRSLKRLPSWTPWSLPSEPMRSVDGHFFQDPLLNSGGGLCRRPCFGLETSRGHSDSRTVRSAGKLLVSVPRRMHSSVSADRKDVSASAPPCGPSQSQTSGALWSSSTTRACEPERRPYSDSFLELALRAYAVGGRALLPGPLPQQRRRALPAPLLRPRSPGRLRRPRGEPSRPVSHQGPP
uniref:Uncharacterized protein n=1 Tax=Alexandrium monilatum TaxID=311494 RepID=A0A7S4RH32_9DINO